MTRSSRQDLQRTREIRVEIRAEAVWHVGSFIEMGGLPACQTPMDLCYCTERLAARKRASGPWHTYLPTFLLTCRGAHPLDTHGKSSAAPGLSTADCVGESTRRSGRWPMEWSQFRHCDRSCRIGRGPVGAYRQGSW